MKMNIEFEKLLAYYFRLWNLTPDGEILMTNSSILKPVMYKNRKSMLKIPIAREEKVGSKLMIWWNGVGAVKVLEYDDNAILMEKIIGNYSLTQMAINNRDDEASGIICDVANVLHSLKKEPLPELVPLEIWFKDLFLFAQKFGDTFIKCADIARNLLQSQRDIVVLHGDLHHNNILYSENRGWLAIDPKGLIGDRTFDYVNILCNPNGEIALKEGRLNSQIDVISRKTRIEHNYILRWSAAWAALSAIWSLNDGVKNCTALDIAKISLNELNN